MRFASSAQSTGITPRALSKLLLYDWPGNVRELQHEVERLLLFASGTMIDDGDIHIGIDNASADSFKEAKTRVVDSFERSCPVRQSRQCD